MNIYEAIVVAGIENCQIRRSGWCEGYAIMPTDSQKTAMVMITPTKVQPANLYVISKDKLGEASAREMIVEVGRVAMADEMIARIEKKRTALEREV